MSGNSYHYGYSVTMHGGSGNTGIVKNGTTGDADPALRLALAELLQGVRELREQLPVLAADAAPGADGRRGGRGGRGATGRGGREPGPADAGRVVGQRRAERNADQADRVTTRTGPSGFLLSRTGTVSS